MERILIMGASSGIGRELAVRYLEAGAQVALAARRTDRFADLEQRFPGQTVTESIDINADDAPRRLNTLIEKLGGMDLYIHASGIGYDNPSLDPTLEAEVITTNAAGFSRMVSAAYRYFRDNRRRGHIAAITSVAGTKGICRMAAYSASKKCAQTYLVALGQLSRSDRSDVVFTDIRPGWTHTALLSDDLKYPMEMPLDYVVTRIMRGIRRRRRVIVIDWRWNIIVGLWRLLPQSLWIRLGRLFPSITHNPAAPRILPFP